MSTVFEPKTKSKTSSKTKPTAKEQVNKKRKNELKGTLTRPNIFEMGDILSQRTDTSLEIFHEKEESGRSTLPSIRTSLTSRDKDSVETVIVCGTMSKALPSIDEKNEKLQYLSISHMFSDGLSQKENFGEQFCDLGGSDDSQTDSLLFATNLNEDKGYAVSIGGNRINIKNRLFKNLQKNRSSPLFKASEWKKKWTRLKLEKDKNLCTIGNNSDKFEFSGKTTESSLRKIDWNSFSFINNGNGQAERSNETIHSTSSLKSLGNEFTVCPESRHPQSSSLQINVERNKQLKNTNNVSAKDLNIFSDITINNSSENIDAGSISFLNKSLDKSQQPIFKKSVKNKKQFRVSGNSSPVSYIERRICNEKENNSASVTLEPVNFTSKKTENYNEKECEAGSYDSETDFPLSGIISEKTNKENISIRKYKKRRYNVSAEFDESHHTETNLPGTNFNQDPKFQNTDVESDANTNTFRRRIMSNSAVKQYSSSVTFLNNSTDQSQHPKMIKSAKNVKQFINSRDSSLTLSSEHRINEGNIDLLTSPISDRGTCESIVTADCDVCDTTVNIALSECNLDHITNSYYSMDGSIERMNKRASRYLNNDDLMNTEVGLTPKLTNYHNAENLGNFESMYSRSDFDEDDSDSESKEKNNATKFSTQQSESFVEIFGTPISVRSRISLTPYRLDLDLSPNLSTTSRQKDSNYIENGQSSFAIEQYLQSPFLNQLKTNNKHDKINCCKMRNTVRQVVDEHVCSNNNDKPEHRKKFSVVNSDKKCLKRLYPFNENIYYLDRQVDTERPQNFVIDVDGMETHRSEKPFVEINQMSSTSFGSSIISVKNIDDPSTCNSFWKVSHEVQSFVMEWLCKNNETNNQTP